eukprot:2381821-Pyramimonas_sp.AAC.1
MDPLSFGPAPWKGGLGNVFIDGSCFRHPIRELSRAANSVVMVDDTGDSMCEFRAPVWCPQTPQSAEVGCWTWANYRLCVGLCVQ